MTELLVVRTQQELRAALSSELFSRGGGVQRAVVMTMGALHEGHGSLIRLAREMVGDAGHVVVTIFVNPLQFGAGEDFERYPRSMNADLEVARVAGADVVFAPGKDAMYPSAPMVTVHAGRMGTVWEGAARPGHFDGVLTVVLKFLHVVEPDIAVFGHKDAQQLAAIRRMTADLDLPVQVIGAPIVRDDDGLALSSRNAYLSGQERGYALNLNRALLSGDMVAREGGSASQVQETAAGMLAEAVGVDLDYAVLVDPDTMEIFPEDRVGRALLMVAARVGRTRLIDNMVVEITPQGEER